MNSSGNSSTNMALDFIGKLFEKFRRPLGFFLLLVLTSILQHIFDMHFVCSCQPGGHVNDELYIILPSLILTFAVYVVKIFYKKKFFSTVDCCGHKRFPRTCFFFGRRVFELLSVTALWAAMVLFDGDWYFCVKTNLNSTQTGLPCKKNLTYKEERIKDSYKTDSLDIGLGVCCGLLILCSLVESFRARCRSWCHWCRRPYYEAMYKKILSDELSLYIEEEFKKIAKKKAMEMCEPKIKIIRNYELPQSKRRENEVSQSNESETKDSQNNVSEKEFSQAWKDISDPKFIFTWQRPASNETADQPVTPERPPDVQNVLNQDTTQDSSEEAEGNGQGKPAIPFGINKASSSSSFKSFGGGDERHLEKAHPHCAYSASGGVGEGQHGQPCTPSAKCPLEDLADCSDPVEEGAQLGGNSGGESEVSGKGVSGEGQVEEQVSQVAERGGLVGGIVSGVFTEVVDELEVSGEAPMVYASPAVCVDGGGETSELVSKECVVDDSDAGLED